MLDRKWVRDTSIYFIEKENSVCLTYKTVFKICFQTG